MSQPFARSPARSCMHQRALLAACSRSLVGWSEALSAAPMPGMDPWSAALRTSGAAAPAWQANLDFSMFFIAADHRVDHSHTVYLIHRDTKS